MSACSICRLAIYNDGTTFHAFGRPLFPVHEHCAPLIHAGMRLLGLTALQVGREALRCRAPAAFAALEGARMVVQRFGELQTENPPAAVPAASPQPQRARKPSWHPPENVIDVQGA
jgi:hypothetical protein